MMTKSKANSFCCAWVKKHVTTVFLYGIKSGFSQGRDKTQQKCEGSGVCFLDKHVPRKPKTCENHDLKDVCNEQRKKLDQTDWYTPKHPCLVRNCFEFIFNSGGVFGCANVFPLWRQKTWRNFSSNCVSFWFGLTLSCGGWQHSGSWVTRIPHFETACNANNFGSFLSPQGQKTCIVGKTAFEGISWKKTDSN